MAIPVVVMLDRAPSSPLDLTAKIAPGSLAWSSVVPGGFASCSFALQGDPRVLARDIPYLSTVRIVGSSGRLLFEGQVEDRQVTISDSEIGLTVTCFGLQNALKEQTVRRIWSKRDMAWSQYTMRSGMKNNSSTALIMAPWLWQVNTGQFDPANLAKTGVQIMGIQNQVGVNLDVAGAEYILPPGFYATTLKGIYDIGGAAAITAAVHGDVSGAYGNDLLGGSGVGPGTLININFTSLTDRVRLSAFTTGSLTMGSDNCFASFYNLRLLCTSIVEDDATLLNSFGGGFYGGTLIRDLVAQVPALQQGVIEDGKDYLVTHLDAGVRRAAYDILTEVAAYYSREWAVWEDRKLDWKTPNLAQVQWIIPIAQLDSLDLDASVVNSRKQAIVLYTDAVSGLDAEASATSTDRRNPYVLGGRAKDDISSASLTMTANTAQQLATALLNDLGFGPVPAAGTISVLGEALIQHAQGHTQKAWEIRAGDNITIPELPMSDVFARDGRGEVTFHVISAEANGDSGTMTFTLDSYGSKRSDVLLARLADVTNLLGG